MNLKPVEMQIAIPRTQEATLAQQHMQHKPIADQQLIAEKTNRQADEKSHKPNQVDSASHARIEREPFHERQSQKERQRKSGKAETEEIPPSPENQANPPSHPYKGRHIDYSL